MTRFSCSAALAALVLGAGCSGQPQACVPGPHPALVVSFPTPVLVDPVPGAGRVPVANVSLVVSPGQFGESVRLLPSTGPAIAPIPLVALATTPAYGAQLPTLSAATTYEVFVDAVRPGYTDCGVTQGGRTTTFDLGGFTTQ